MVSLRFSRLAPILAGFLAVVNANPLAKRNGTCTSLNQRKSWNVLTDDERSEFLRANKCLMEIPPRTGTIWNAQNRWDEFSYVHISMANYIHDSGQFLAWHRWYIKVLELDLQEYCNYTGALPYWDELKDQATAPLNESAIFDPVTGFGGDGDPNKKYCISDGPFANITLVGHEYDEQLCSRLPVATIQPDSVRPRYVPSMRKGEPFFVGSSSGPCTDSPVTNNIQGPDNWDLCKDYSNYTTYWECSSNNIHGLGHIGVGGTEGLMANAVTSSGDPLFFLHHAWLDRAWWKWQLQDKENRLYDMGGRNMELDIMVSYLGLSQPNKFTTDYSGDGDSNTTTLGHVLYTHDLRANVTVGDVMDLNADTICAEYVDDGGFNYTLGY